SEGKSRTPMMVHRALFGSLERFFAMLIEHYAGEFPFWLAPVQIGIVPIRESHNDYAVKLSKKLKSLGLRVNADTSDDQMRTKIRRMELDKLPIIFVIGDREVEQGGVSVRSRREIGDSGKGNLGFMSLEAFMDFIEPEINKGMPQYLDE
ncbi:MAG: His/Gly/Thr/Pro-type tRNA ligase C-terminal domain-containing protein, partial [Bacillota bacterium]|nr:His/Gly/Thr/Pro-type tRNA ligase C-terminal domain-containing protein [Bacillota bacterium]